MSWPRPELNPPFLARDLDVTREVEMGGKEKMGQRRH